MTGLLDFYNNVRIRNIHKELQQTEHSDKFFFSKCLEYLYKGYTTKTERKKLNKREKFTKLSQMGFSMKCFIVHFSAFF